MQLTRADDAADAQKHEVGQGQRLRQVICAGAQQVLLNRPAAWMQRHDGIVGQVAVRSRRAAAMPSCPIPGGERAAGQQPPALAQPARHVSHRHAGCHALSFRGEARWLDELGGSGMHGIGGSSCRQGRPRQQRGPWWQQRQLSGGGGGGSNSGGSNSGGRSRATGLAVVITPIGMPEGERRRVREPLPGEEGAKRELASRHLEAATAH